MAARTKTSNATVNEGSATTGGADKEYIASQPADKRALLERLRTVVVGAVPNADVGIKWGVPVYEVGGKRPCSVAAFKEHVAMTFFAPPEALADPKGQLEGAGKGMRSLKVRSAADIDAASIRRWLKAAAR